MSKYRANIEKTSAGSFYALILRIDKGGETHVIHGFRGFYATEARAQRAIAAHMAKHGMTA